MSISLVNSKCSLFEYLGLVVFGYVALKLAYKILNNLGSFVLGTGSVNLKKYGSWAIVTGCTDGIGKSYAEQLAKRGLNVVLISRTLEKLQEQAKHLREKYSVETRVIAADFTGKEYSMLILKQIKIIYICTFSQEPNNIYPQIKSQIADLEIAILVNNVGVSYKHPEYFDVFAENDQAVSDMINCNITSVTKMTGLVLPGMLKRRKGIIVNNASASGRTPTPLLAVYSATKAYVDFFSR